jgi:hypothetical protein
MTEQISDRELELMVNMTVDSICAGTPFKIAIKSIIQDAFNKGVAEGKEESGDILEQVNKTKEKYFKELERAKKLYGAGDVNCELLRSAWNSLYKLNEALKKSFGGEK